MDDADGSVGVREVAVTLRKPPWPKGSLEAVGSVICHLSDRSFALFPICIPCLTTLFGIFNLDNGIVWFPFPPSTFFLLGELALWILALLSPACIKTRLIQPRPSLPTQTARPNWKMGRTASPISSSSTKFQPRDGRGLVPSPAGSRLLHLGLSASRESQKSRAVFEEPSEPNPTRVAPFRRRHRDENRDTDNQPTTPRPHHSPPTTTTAVVTRAGGVFLTATQRLGLTSPQPRRVLPTSATYLPSCPAQHLTTTQPASILLQSRPQKRKRMKWPVVQREAELGSTPSRRPPIFSMRQGDCGTCGMPPQISRFGFFEPLSRPIPRLEKKKARGLKSLFCDGTI